MQLARLDDRLERVGELRHGLHLQRGLAVVGAEARGRVGDLGLGRVSHDPGPQPLQQLLWAREVLDRVDLAIADDHVRVASEDRADELRDVRALVLVVGVGVDDHVRAELQSRVEAGLERGREALVVGQLDDVIDAELARHLDRPIGRAIVDDQEFDDVKAGYLAGELADRQRQLALLVETRDLDDELHWHLQRTVPRSARSRHPWERLCAAVRRRGRDTHSAEHGRARRSPAPARRRRPTEGPLEPFDDRPPGGAAAPDRLAPSPGARRCF